MPCRAPGGRLRCWRSSHWSFGFWWRRSCDVPCVVGGAGPRRGEVRRGTRARSGPIPAPGPVAGQVELVLVQARGGGPATAGGEADREGGGAPLRGGGAGRGLVPPGVQQAAGSGAEGGGDGADLAVDDSADQRRGGAEGAGDPGAVVAHRDQGPEP